MLEMLIVLCLLAAGATHTIAATFPESHGFQMRMLQIDKSNINELALKQITLKYNMQLIDTHNKAANKSYSLKANRFASLSQKEFTAMYLGSSSITIQDPSVNLSSTNPLPKKFSVIIPPPSKPFKASIDYRMLDGVSEVRDQGLCAGCYAFVTTAQIQSALRLKDLNPIAVRLSVQQLLDCTGEYGNFGCSQGMMLGAMQYIVDHGIYTQEDYPFVGVSSKCKYPNATKLQVSSAHLVTNFYNKSIEYGGCNAVFNALLNQPLAVAVNADYKWMFYEKGAFSDCVGMDKGTSQITHAVLLVGYQRNGTNPYWIIKNSWSTTWGMKGFMYIAAKATSNPCNLCNYATYIDL